MNVKRSLNYILLPKVSFCLKCKEMIILPSRYKSKSLLKSLIIVIKLYIKRLLGELPKYIQ